MRHFKVLRRSLGIVGSELARALPDVVQPGGIVRRADAPLAGNPWSKPGTAAGSDSLPVLPWRTLDRASYRVAVTSGVIEPGIFVEEVLDHHKATAVLVHGAEGAPAQFATLAAALGGRTNAAVFLWDDTARLAPGAERLRAALTDWPRPVIVVAHSMGALLLAYVGATDCKRQLEDLTAVYLNPLIGGSRYAGDFRALRWLRIGALLQRLLLRPSVLDLAPESDFQQAIFGPASAASSFAARSVVLFTERPREEPDIRPDRVPHYFGRTRDELLERMGRVVQMPPARRNGHRAPLIEPEVVLPLVDGIVNTFTNLEFRSARGA
jgi:hypothetical protein